jgi:hypothetical protein
VQGETTIEVSRVSRPLKTTTADVHTQANQLKRSSLESDRHLAP